MTDYTEQTLLQKIGEVRFALVELQLYLDTHPKDEEALNLMKSVLGLTEEAKRRYVAKYGPLCPADLQSSGRFDWIDDPWPWLYGQKGE